MKIDGKKIAQKIYKDIIKKIAELPQKPRLAIILVGNDEASKIYVSLKIKKAKELGIKVYKYHFKDNILQNKIIEKINELNTNLKINGILIQVPLPKHLKVNQIIKKISPQKDVDGFLKNSLVISPPVLATIESLKSTNINFTDEKCAILVNSKNFGNLLKNNLKKFLKLKSEFFTPQKENWVFVKNADIVVCARGNPHFLKKDHIKKGAILIDIGITRIKNKVYGDISFAAQKKSSYYTPVPGGIGPLTVAFLFKNLMNLTKLQYQRSESTTL